MVGVDYSRMARIALALFLVFFCLAVPLGAAVAASAHVVPVEGPIGPATSDLVTRSIDAAAADGADLIVLRLDTPGGLDSSMRAIVRAAVEAPLPVVGYVGPSGARAASAGTFILYATHLAAMAPGTNLGAATPVPIGGGGEERSASDAKAIEDAAAYIRSLAELRGRDPVFAEAAVREARSLTAREALDAGVIDLMAGNLDALLQDIDGRAVELARGSAVVESADAAVTVVEPDWRYQLLAVITNPNVAAILMLVGVLGIVFELFSPGLVGPGLVGAISLLLALYAFQVLPVSHAGLALLVLGMALIVAEAFVPSFGVLGIGGIAAFIAGAVLLMETDVPGFGVSPWLIGAFAASTSAVFLLTLGMVLKGSKMPVVTGPEAVVHGQGKVVRWQGLQGQVRLDGELWQAAGPRDLAPGTPVTVTSRDGLTLVVAPMKPTK